MLKTFDEDIYVFQVSKRNTNNEKCRSYLSFIPIMVFYKTKCSNQTNVSFFYNLYLKSRKLFSLKACSLDETTLLKLTRSGTGWKQARVDIPVDNHGRQIIFEAERGNSASDVAIDDVSLSNKECPPGNFFYYFRVILI